MDFGHGGKVFAEIDTILYTEQDVDELVAWLATAKKNMQAWAIMDAAHPKEEK